MLLALPPLFVRADSSAQLVEAMNRGVGLMNQYEYNGAAKMFEQALTIAPSLTIAEVDLAIARFNRANRELNDLEQSMELLDKALKAEPTNAQALYFKGIVLQHQSQTEEAIACFEKVAELCPDDGGNWFLLGMCKLRAGQKAEKELRRAIELRPYLVSAWYQLWQALRTAGQPDEAKACLEKFKQLRENPLAETIELAQYGQMGPLAYVRPLPAVLPITKSTCIPQSPIDVIGTNSSQQGALDRTLMGGAAMGDFNKDGILDMVIQAGGDGRLELLMGGPNGRWTNTTAASGLGAVKGAVTCSVGDVDNDDNPDLIIATTQGCLFFRGKGDGTFAGSTMESGLGTATNGARHALLLDADHDGDLDLLTCGLGTNGCQYWRNNGDGLFTNVTDQAGLACSGSACTVTLCGDIDRDRDMDLIIMREGKPALVFVNELLNHFREVDCGAAIHGELGGVLQDFNGDGILDILALGGFPARLRLYLGDGRARFREDETFAKVAESAGSWGTIRSVRVADIDLDGDLDIAIFSTDGHLLLNDGQGRFVLRPQFWKGLGPMTGVELADVNNDLIPDLLRISAGHVDILPNLLSPPSTGIGVNPTGLRNRDKRTRSPASGFGAALTLRAGLHEQAYSYTGQGGGFSQSCIPAAFGLGGIPKADYLHILWPDGVAQVETDLAAGQVHRVSELQRKTSSCPVLFTWNGSRFEFVTDFAGVGGLGYFTAPGEYAKPEPTEFIKIEGAQLVPRDGAYELRITEPMEEAAYVDQLELLAIDHPADSLVFPDERLVITGPPATRELICIQNPIFPLHAFDLQGRDCASRLKIADRQYAYEPKLDRRFFGFADSHVLDLDFGCITNLSSTNRIFLFINGYLEYPYSQTAFAASQAGVGWKPIQIEKLDSGGQWHVVVPDAGALGGAARTMTVDLTGLLSQGECRLRLTTDLELYYDQVYLASPISSSLMMSQSLPLLSAELRHCGFAHEYSPDGRQPLIYDYQISDATAPFHVLKGDYTRFGPVEELLSAFDDCYVIMGPGEEIAVRFDALHLPAPAAGMTRSFVLVSHTYCKDMDLYTATPQTIEPLPFKKMSAYPPPASEHYPEAEANRRYRETYNTRRIE